MDSRVQPTRRSAALQLPNILTYGRILAVPAFVGAMFLEQPADAAAHWSAYPNWIALLIFVVACVTDFFDGYLARIWALQSSLGRMLDPIADKLLVGAALIMLVANQMISGWSIWAAIIILSREILVSGLREYLADLRVKVTVTQLAKWKTTAQMVAIGFLIAGPAGDKLTGGWATPMGLGLLWLAALLTLYTGYDYFRAGLRHVFDD
jgi:cardiolipin synthase